MKIRHRSKASQLDDDTSATRRLYIGQILAVKAEDKLPITWGKVKDFRH